MWILGPFPQIAPPHYTQVQGPQKSSTSFREDPRHQPTSVVSSTPQPHTREDQPGAPPHIGAFDLVNLYLRRGVARLKKEGGDMVTRPLPLDYTASLHTSPTPPEVLHSVRLGSEAPAHLGVSSTPQPRKREPARGSTPHCVCLYLEK